MTIFGRCGGILLIFLSGLLVAASIYSCMYALWIIAAVQFLASAELLFLGVKSL